MKHGQIKMFETIGVLVVFFFLLVGGTTFYFKIQESAMQKELVRQAQLRSLQAAQRAMFLPELDCSFVSIQRENCFDRLKLKAFGSVSQSPKTAQSYFGQFGFATVIVREAYPSTDFIVTIYTSIPDEYGKVLLTQTPVLLYDPVTKDFGFGVMEVTTYAE